MLTLNTLGNFVEYHAFAAYVLIILGVIIEGEIVVIIAGIFAYLGFINIFVAFMATIFGGLSKSAIGYMIGYFLNKNHSHRSLIKRAENRITYFLPQFREKPFWSIFISRFFIFGLNWFTLIFSGYMNVKIKTYIRAEVASLVLWACGMLALGYFVSHTALSISRDIRKFLGIILLFFIAFFIFQKFVSFCIDQYEDRYRNKDNNV
ncbi:VTT domain-containing protein [Candidatus Nomurabacteria bacterium]|nr:VTT domain-containing protein [Candidatus Nomurabacteria bacterium]